MIEVIVIATEPPDAGAGPRAARAAAVLAALRGLGHRVRLCLAEAPGPAALAALEAAWGPVTVAGRESRRARLVGGTAGPPDPAEAALRELLSAGRPDALLLLLHAADRTARSDDRTRRNEVEKPFRACGCQRRTDARMQIRRTSSGQIRPEQRNCVISRLALGTLKS